MYKQYTSSIYNYIAFLFCNQDLLSLDSSGSDSVSGDSNSDVDYVPNAEKKGENDSHKKTAEKQSRHNKLKRKGKTRKLRSFGDKPVEKTRGKSKSSKKTATADSSEETNTKQKKEKNKKASQKKTHSRSRKKENMDSEESGSEDKECNDKKNAKKKRPHRKNKGDSSDNDNEDSAPENTENNSTDYDSELEKDIEKLARAPQISSKKSKSKRSDTPDSDSKKSSKKSDSKKEKRGSQKSKQKIDRLEELSSGEASSMDEVEEMEVGEEEDLQAAGERALAELERAFDMVADYDEEEKARQELLADDSPESSDSDVDEMLAEKIEGKKSTAKKSDTEKDDCEEEVESQETDASSNNVRSKVGSKKSKFGKNKLLDAQLSDSEEDFEIKPSKKSKSKKSEESSEDIEEQVEEDEEGKDALTDVSSDFDIKPKKKVAKRRKKKSSSSDSSESNSDSDESKKKGKKGKQGKKKGRKRIKVASDSDEEANSDDSDENNDDGKGNKRKKIRKLIKDKKLSVDTKSAAKAEEERRKRIEERQKQYNQIDEEDVNSPTKAKITTKLVLEMDEETKKPVIEVNSSLIRKLKPHQVEAVRFMWDCCIESLDRAKKEEGAGCILAHCMGLGKTLSVITFIHTLMKNADLTGVNTCLIVCPLNTVLNWQRELGHWLDENEQLLVDELTSVKDNHVRCHLLEEWHNSGGCMIMGYEMYRNLSTLRNIKKAKQKKILTSTLIDPGPDIVVCDEGHILKNDASALSKAMTKIRTKKRIALTGTPLQNNLVEYHCMVDFVKPKLLGTRKEFMNRFVNPIKNGQCSDSSDHDVKLMKKRAHILHETLAGCVQRRDYSALTKFLPPKHEYVISVRLSEVQMELYEQYLNRMGSVPTEGEKIKGAKLFSDYQALMRIWTHPWVLKLQEIREEMKKMYDDTDEDSFIDDSEEESCATSQSSSSEQEEESVQEVSSGSESERNRRSRRSTRSNRNQQNEKKGEVVKSWKTKSRGGDTDSVKTTASTESDKKQSENGEDPISSEWWAEHITEEDKYSLEISGKMMLLSEVLRMSENIGDKVLVFSQSLLSLDLIEDFLNHWDTDDSESQTGGTMGWTKGVDYFRMDGSTSAMNRKAFASTFNDMENVRARLFLISTKAGSLGTNLVGANRVIIFDASWNPSHDTQSIFRVYRFGQTKPVYIYRFLAQGTMEEKIYERQVTKQSLSQRVVDEHQVERHFTNADLTELYNFKPERFDECIDYIPVLPKDMMLADLLTEKKQWIVKYHEHDSLLENKIEEDLTEEERKSAWEEFELEKKHGFRPAVRPMLQATSQVYNYNNINTQYARGATNSIYVPPPQFSVKEIEELAKSIYAANPGINQVELQMRVQTYVARQQQLFQQRQREQMLHEMARLRHLQDERRRQELALQDAYSKAQAQGTSSSGPSASSLLRTLVGGPRQTSMDSQTPMVQTADPTKKSDKPS